jgi:TonB family protein
VVSRTSLDRAVEAAAADAVRHLDRDAGLGARTGTGQNLGGLQFDPQGADFTLWVNHFKNDLFRNWVMPQPFFLGAQGHVDFEFVVERNGTLSAVRLLRSSGVVSFDRAAQNALSSSRLLPLPDDYRPQRVTMLLTFSYNERPQGS